MRLGGTATAIASALVLASAAGLSVRTSHAELVPPGAPLTVIVGPSGGSAAAPTTERLDAQRRSLSNVPLPTRSLGIVWTRQLRPLAGSPVIEDDGTVLTVSERGDAVFVNPDGSDAGRLSIGPGPMSAPLLLGDGTIVAANGAGELVGIRRMEVAFRSRVADPQAPADPTRLPPQLMMRASGRSRGRTAASPRPFAGMMRPYLMPTEDGGLLVAVGRDLVTTDSSGAIKARARAFDAVVAPPVAVGGVVALVGAGGAVSSWDLTSGVDGVRSRGSFGGSVEGVAAFDARHLVGIVKGTSVVSLDLESGTVESWAATSGAFTDALAVGKDVAAQEISASGTHLLEVGREGRGLVHGVALSSQGASLLVDAGAESPFRVTGTELVVDPSGAIAYATVDGHVGVVVGDEKHELGPLPCGSPAVTAARFGAQPSRTDVGFVGLVPSGPGAFVVACESGALSLVRGETAAAAR